MARRNMTKIVQPNSDEPRPGTDIKRVKRTAEDRRKGNFNRLAWLRHIARGVNAELLKKAYSLGKLVADTAAESPPSDLVVIDQVLDRARLEITCIRNRSITGECVVDLPPARREAYFPVTTPPSRAPDATRQRRAELYWAEATDRGYKHREAVLREVGPLLTPRQAKERLGVTAATLSNWRRAGKLLGLRLDDHQYLYPEWQFVETPAAGERGVLRHLEEALGSLGSMSAWGKALWLTRQNPALGGKSPLAMLRRGSRADLELVSAAAVRAGEMEG